VFDTVAEHYVRGRSDMPLEAVRDASRVLGLAPGSRVLEVGAGAGALTAQLVAAEFDVVALEPGAALRERLTARVPDALVHAATFEEYEPGVRFDAIFSSNAWHWVDPEVAYVKAARVARAIVLMWDMPIPADADLFRSVQDDVMQPNGSTFPNNEHDARAMFESDAAAGRQELAESALFDEPWWRIYDRDLPFTREQYVSLILSMSNAAAAPEDAQRAVADGLRAVLPDEFTLRDPVYVLATRVKG
jgi:SAM-dependent methyltransferase